MTTAAAADAAHAARQKVNAAIATAAELQWLAAANRTAARELEHDAEIRERTAAAGVDVDEVLGQLRICGRALDRQAQTYRQHARATADAAGLDVPEDEIDPIPF